MVVSISAKMRRAASSSKDVQNASSIRCLSFGVVLIATVSFRSNHAMAFSVNDCAPMSFASHRVVSSQINQRCSQIMTMSRHDEDNNCNNYHETQMKRLPGRKRALLRKYGKSIALSTTLLYGPMALIPSGRHNLGSTAHAASPTMAATNTLSGGDYKFKDFKDIKGKISLAPGANVQQYEEILAKVEVEGEKAFEDLKHGDIAALTIGESRAEIGEASSSSGKSLVKKKQKESKKKSQVSEWESEEFGFGEGDDDDLDSGVLSLASSGAPTKGKLSPSKSKSGVSGSGEKGGGDVLLTDKMAYNNYKAPMSKEEQTKVIKKFAFYSIFPVFVITTIRGQIKAYKEKKWFGYDEHPGDHEFRSLRISKIKSVSTYGRRNY
ncbi:hypothetical protein ACHAW5_009224 [Stephanodiscus triporus]|uniref:Uncharacterized protein n=1 Tax=Stephanodiscus triporus TaxID=2934178 RepID=A0ABD3PM70_9STRA